MVARANRALVALVEARLPERFWPSEDTWRIAATAMVARMAGMLDSITALLGTRRQSDALILIRVLYEHVVVFCWMLIDPEERVIEWASNATRRRRTLHFDAADFGIEVMAEEELAEAEGARLHARLGELADEVDDFWPARVRGLRQHAPEGPRNLLAFRGLYVGLYRVASRTVHAQADSVDPCAEVRGRVRRVFLEEDDTVAWSGWATPLFGMALVVCHYRLGWPDEQEVRRINDELTRLE